MAWLTFSTTLHLARSPFDLILSVHFRHFVHGVEEFHRTSIRCLHSRIKLLQNGLCAQLIVSHDNVLYRSCSDPVENSSPRDSSHERLRPKLGFVPENATGWSNPLVRRVAMSDSGQVEEKRARV